MQVGSSDELEVQNLEKRDGGRTYRLDDTGATHCEGGRQLLGEHCTREVPRTAFGVQELEKEDEWMEKAR